MATMVSTESLVWIAASGGETVSDAIVAGSAEDGAELHIARASLELELAVGKVHIGHEYAYIPYYEEEVHQDEYEVLSNPGCVELEWVSASCGEVPVGAVEGGTCEEGQPIYVARCPHENDIVPGKVVPRCEVIFIPWGGEEISYSEYEILCVKTVKPQSQC